MLFDNYVNISGRVLRAARSIKDHDRHMVTVQVILPAKDNELSVKSYPLDFLGDKGKQAADAIKAGDYIDFTGSLGFMEINDDEGKTKRIGRIEWDPYTRVIRVPGDGTVPPADKDPILGKNFARLIGLCGLAYSDKQEGLRNPKLRSGRDGNNSFCFFQVGWKRMRDDKIAYHDITAFGAAAEKRVSKYLLANDTVMINGYVFMRDEQFKLGGQVAKSVTLRPTNFNGISWETPRSKDNSGSGSSEEGGGAPSYGGKGDRIDDDLPF